MKFFYCQSYLAFNIALQYKDVTIITSQPDIVKACGYLKIPCEYHMPFMLNDFLLHKRKILNEAKRLCKIIDEREFHFSHAQYAVFCFVLLQFLKRREKNCLFHDFEYRYSKVSQNSFAVLKSKIILVLLNVLYSNLFELRELKKGQPVISLSNKEMKSTTTIHYEEEEYNQKVEKVVLEFESHLETMNGCFFIDQGMTNDQWDQHEVRQLLRYMKDKSFYIKEHPIHTPKDYFKGFEKLPSFLPVELFLSSMKGLLISPYSNALIVASKSLSVKAVSLLYMIKDENLKKQMKEKLQVDSEGKIIFVHSLRELQKIIDGIE